MGIGNHLLRWRYNRVSGKLELIDLEKDYKGDIDDKEVIQQVEQKLAIVDITTGEVKRFLGTKQKPKQTELEEMLSSAETLEDIDIKLVYWYLKKTGEINKYNQIKLKGRYFSLELIEKLAACKYAQKFLFMTSLVSSNTGCIKKSETVLCKNWGELREVLDVGKTFMSEFKKWLILEDLIREFIIVDSRTKKPTKRLIMNPLMFRNGSHTSQMSLLCYRDICDPYLSSYAKLFMKCSWMC